MSNSKYCNSLTSYSRRESRVVNIGEIPMGGNHPIRVQSMTTTNTMDTMATVEQSIRMIDAGCEYVRITAPSKKEAENLANIKKELQKRGYDTPLIADIHFTPNAAEVAARIVEKVRINPGNFVDRKKFEQIEYTDAEYDGEIQRIGERFLPLVNICKEYGTAMRIGTNHGSLSDRILSRYGDTPMGMVESAMEFLRICRAESYHQIILSMKSSNPLVMVQAYRLLVNRMDAEGMDYSLHLGVTEAGEGEDGRIKSALGIGTLLEDGLGDTIRVSLTEEPEYEIPVAKTLVDRYTKRSGHDEIPKIDHNPILPFEYQSRKTHSVLNIGGENVPRVINDLVLLDAVTPKTLTELGYTYFKKEDKWGISDLACDFIDIGKKEIDFEIPGTLGIIQAYSVWKYSKKDRHYPFLDVDEYLDGTGFHPQLNMLYMTLPKLTDEIITKINNDSTIVLFIDTYNEHGMAEQRRMFIKLMNSGCAAPVIIGRAYSDLTPEDLQVHASTDMGALLVDGLGDGIYVASEDGLSDVTYTATERCASLSSLNSTAFGILQASRRRITKTEYISCPSCGRTLFDLQETTARIRARTEHLKGIKIGIMGCIVNGPGEMADADYGYVGTGVGKITLYKGQEVVSKNMATEDADEALIQLIKDHGDWVEPKTVNS